MHESVPSAAFVMYYVCGESGSSLLTVSTDSMILLSIFCLHFLWLYPFNFNREREMIYKKTSTKQQNVYTFSYLFHLHR